MIEEMEITLPNKRRRESSVSEWRLDGMTRWNLGLKFEGDIILKQ